MKSQIDFLVNYFCNSILKRFEVNTENTRSSIDDRGSERVKDAHEMNYKNCFIWSRSRIIFLIISFWFSDI